MRIAAVIGDSCSSNDDSACLNFGGVLKPYWRIEVFGSGVPSEVSLLSEDSVVEEGERLSGVRVYREA